MFYLNVEDSSYRILYKESQKSPFLVNKIQENINSHQNEKHNTQHSQSKLSYISECTDPICIYTRQNTKIREIFEKKIVDESKNKSNIKILFYGSFLLYQEFRFLLLMGNRIAEIHFTDYAYQFFLSHKPNPYILAFNEYVEQIKTQNFDIKVYVHDNPDKLKTSKKFQRRFDIICGIDIDYSQGKLNNRPTMKEIAINTLKINGFMYLSQNYLDQVDICRYEIVENGDVRLITSDDYIKPAYYFNYAAQSNLISLYYPLCLTGFVISCFLVKKNKYISFIASNIFTIGIIHNLLDNSQNYFKRNIKKFTSIIK